MDITCLNWSEVPWFERKSPSLRKQVWCMLIYSCLSPLAKISRLNSVPASQQKVTTLPLLQGNPANTVPIIREGQISIWADIPRLRSLPSDVKADLLHATESNSCETASVLKRPDEKAVAKAAYENPRFVEDLARLIAADLFELEWVSAFELNAAMKNRSISTMPMRSCVFEGSG